MTWPTEKPTSFGLFWARSPAWWCWLIRRITGSDWPHVGVWFGWPDGTRLRAEALTDGMRRARGIAGPLDWASLVAFASRPKCAAIYVEIPASLAAVAAMYDEARVLQRFGSYAELQLLAMWARERLGMRVIADERRVVCSEYGSRVASVGGIDLRDERRTRHDEVTPGSALVRVLAMGLEPRSVQ